MSLVQTRHQRDMALALTHVRQAAATASGELYGSLCLSLPVLVQTNGLCQTLAFLEEKSSGKPDSAHRLLLNHIAEVLGVEPGKLLDAVRTAPLMTYIHYSRRIMSAWVYYKRFSVSILNADPTADTGGA